MGVGMAYVSKKTSKHYATRGIKIILSGIILNICRFLIPYLIGYVITGDYEKFITWLPYRFFGNDIFQFAGLAMIIMALFIRLGIPTWGMVAITFVMSLAGTLVNGMDFGVPVVNVLMGHLIGTEDAAGMVFSDFPLLNWLIVPINGYAFGQILMHVKDKALFYKIISPVSLAITIIYFSIGINNGYGMFGEGQNCYYHITTNDVLSTLFAAYAVLGIYYFLANYIGEKVMAVITETSRNVSLVYCIHWVLVVIVTNIIIYSIRGTQELGIGSTLAVGVAISVVSIYLAHLWSNFQRSRRRAK
jgi:uncharacterized membrane protein